MHVLLVEDNPGDADLIRTYLGTTEGLTDDVEHVDRLEHALDRSGSNPDVALLDLNLPDASPDETIQAIEELSSETAVVVLTGHAPKNLELRALKAGADEFLEKEFLDEMLLRRCIEYAIERHSMRAALRRREHELEKYRIIVEHSTDAVRMKDGNGRFRLVNESFKDVLGRTDSELLGKTTSDVYEEEVAQGIKASELDVLESGEIRTDEEEPKANDDERTMLTTRIPYHVDGEVEGTIAISRDVTERKQMRENLEKQALYDRMTGLPNRSLFRDRFRQILEHCRQRKSSFGLAFLDLDNFKEVNDSLGHLAGDRLIEKVAGRLQNTVRKEDTVARVGGDEFTIIFQTIGGETHLEAIAGRLQELFEQPFDVQGSEVHVSVSIGFSLPDLETLLGKGFEESFESLTRAADRAMYRAKERAGTSWQLADTHGREESSRSIQKENRIRDGIRRDEFVPYFQPIFSIEDRDVLACEMLARWRDPERGMISPAEFISIAEDSALIDDITEMLVERACEQFAESEDGLFEEIDLYVNVSANQLARPGIFDRLRDIIAASLPERMEVVYEVTETALLRHSAFADTLHETGMRLIIDDFGTGHSSLSRLKEMPVDGLKLDMEFVHGIGESSADEAVVETVVELGHRLDLPVTAEGVETREQFEFLRASGCTTAQGYWLARPGSFDDVFQNRGAEP